MNPTFKQVCVAVMAKLSGSEAAMCQLAIQDIIDTTKAKVRADWQDCPLSGDDAINIYGWFLYFLESQAYKLEKIVDDPAWSDANRIGYAIKQVLEETHDDGDLELDNPDITPPWQQAVEQGLLTATEEPDGQLLLTVTPLGERVAAQLELVYRRTQRGGSGVN